jgi:rhodanese-related sulfurtransferase
MLKDPNAVVVDSRTNDWFLGGTIPGAVNIPYTYVVDELAQLGCEPDFDGWDCEAAKPVALFCNGVWCGQSPTAIRNMINAGYPADRIFYYRGGK